MGCVVRELKYTGSPISRVPVCGLYYDNGSAFWLKNALNDGAP